MLELGSTEQSIAKQAVRMGQPIPDRIANAPNLKEGLSFYLQAFFDLDSERSQGFNVGRIPWTAIVTYGRYHGLYRDEIDILVEHIRALDTANLNWIAEKGGGNG